MNTHQEHPRISKKKQCACLFRYDIKPTLRKIITSKSAVLLTRTFTYMQVQAPNLYQGVIFSSKTHICPVGLCFSLNSDLRESQLK